MSKPSFLILNIFLSVTALVFLAEHSTAQGPPTKPNSLIPFCLPSHGNYAANSTYGANVISVISDLQDRGSVSTFYNTSAGSGADTVYGQYFCRGDINSTLCGDCIKQAARDIIGNCTLFKSAIIWYQECTLRYNNESMVGVEAEVPRVWLYSNLNNVSDPQLLASALETTIDRLINDSTQGPFPTLFATGDGAMSAFERVYCLVQCSPDLSVTQCRTCLRSTYAFIPTCCGTMSKLVAILAASCELGYTTTTPFYWSKNSPPPPAGLMPSTPPPPLGIVSDSTPPPSNSKGASVVLRSSGVGLVMTTFTLLILVVMT